jgi:hypothetical protein
VRAALSQRKVIAFAENPGVLSQQPLGSADCPTARPAIRRLLSVATRDHTVQLRPTTYGALEVEATRRHLAPDELADELVRERLAGVGGRLATMRGSLETLERISARMPEVDVVRLVREGREELARRSV